MKSICIRVEDEIHRRLKGVLLYRDSSVQDFVTALLKREIEREALDIVRHDTTGDATKLFQRIGIPNQS